MRRDNNNIKQQLQQQWLQDVEICLEDVEETFHSEYEDSSRSFNSSKTGAGTRATAVSSRSSRRSFFFDDGGNDKEDGGTSADRSWCCRTLLVCLLMAVALVMIVIYVVQEEDTARLPAYCGDCHCIVEQEESNNSTLEPTKATTSCPASPPVTSYNAEFMTTLAAQRPLNAVPPIACNPFQDVDCDFNPPRPVEEQVDTAVCGIHYTNTTTITTTTACQEYQLQTYSTWQLATEAGAYVTHKGACGVCSTMQDLAAYMRTPDIMAATQTCGPQALVQRLKGLECWQHLGFTKPCAALWTARSVQVARTCSLACFLLDAQNGDYFDKRSAAPECALHECLRCATDQVDQKIFSKFAGRTHASSGLVGAVAAPCSAFAHDVHHNTTCPVTTPLIVPPQGEADIFAPGNDHEYFVVEGMSLP